MPRTRSRGRLPHLRSRANERPASGSASTYALPARKKLRPRSISSVTPSSSSTSSNRISRNSKGGSGKPLFFQIPGSSSSGPIASEGYQVLPDERDEDYELAALLGEIEPDEVDGDVPVRLLDHFTLYDYRTQKLCAVPCEYDIDGGYKGRFGGSGIVKSVNDDYELQSEPESEADDEGLLVKLGVLQEVWFSDDEE